jgi:Tol biopolymer transport system component
MSPTTTREDPIRMANDTVICATDRSPVIEHETALLVRNARDASFSPNDSRIVFASDRDHNGLVVAGETPYYANELYSARRDGSDLRRLTYTRSLNEGSPSWSSNGFVTYRRGRAIENAEGSTVWIARADGRCAHRLAFDPGLRVWYRDPVWRPGAAVRVSCRSLRWIKPLGFEPGGNITLATARKFRSFGLYWLGRRFRGVG